MIVDEAIRVQPFSDMNLPGSINPAFEIKVPRKKNYPIELLYEKLINGSRTELSQAITLIESEDPRKQVDAQKLLNLCLQSTSSIKKSIRIGITGVPGVGKSTFIDALGIHILHKNHGQLAVLAIDPSSQRSHGSILGDKTRMENLSQNLNAYIRPSPAARSLGGVARKTRETILLCEAAGFDTIIVETVGVGQSETTVHGMVDFFLLLMLAGAGDELQGIKRGIMELCDGLIIQKSDGDNILAARRAQSEFKNALHLFPPNDNHWKVPVLTSSALHKNGISEAWQMIESYVLHTKNNGFWEQRRREQLKTWFEDGIRELLLMDFSSNCDIKTFRNDLEKKVFENKVNPYHAAEQLIKLYKMNLGQNSSVNDK